jgi:Reverse transcriptase (RNA-dependent DNA polymerase).
MEINKIVIKAINNLYKNALSRIKIGKFVSEEIKVEKSLRLGCSISSTVFKIFIHTTLLNWNRKCSGMGVPIGDGSQDSIHTFLFADDQVLIAQENEVRCF